MGVERPRLLSVAEAASELKASEAYVRRLLLRQRLYGIKVGFVWAIFPEDLAAFKRTRRPPGRPRLAPGDRTPSVSARGATSNQTNQPDDD
ncbi:MAG TPA: hypothetical protein VFB69_03865 [Candidatus Dormibacteraeota bacterium]|nr:hypothetical protein [Candidatus Dormibacteraeota bacterium]